MSTVVYFAQEGQSGPVKIGWTADVVTRLTNLQVGNSVALRILHTVPGGATLEAHIHEALSAFRLSGEWFRPAAPVFDLLDKLKTNGPTIFGAGFQQSDVVSMFARSGKDGTAADIARMQELCQDIADLAVRGHSVKERVAGAGRAIGVEGNRAVELYHGRARRIEAWEMRRAEDAVVLLTFRRAGGPVAVSEREVK